MTSKRYEIEWTRSALGRLDRIPERAAAACIELIYGPLADDPWRVGRALPLDLAGKHSARRGDFRVIDEIDDTAGAIAIIAIDHRSDVYRPR